MTLPNAARLLRALVVLAFLCPAMPANAGIEVRVLQDSSGSSQIHVLFDEEVTASSVRNAAIRCYGVREKPVPELFPLTLATIREKPPSGDQPGLNDLYVFTFQPLATTAGTTAAFMDNEVEYTLVIDGVRNEAGRAIGKQRVSFTRDAKPTLALELGLELGLSGARFGTSRRRYVEVREIVGKVDAGLVAQLSCDTDCSPVPLAPGTIVLALSFDKVDYSRQIPVAAAMVEDQQIRLFLAQSLPQGAPLFLKVTFPSKEEGKTVAVANKAPLTFAAPTGRSDKNLRYSLELAYVSTGGNEASSRNEEGLLDLLIHPGPWPLFDSGMGAWTKRWQPLLDAQIGTDDGEEAKSPNKIVAGVDFLFDGAIGDWGEQRIRAGVRHNSDKDFATRELVGDLRWIPVATAWLRDAEQRTHDFRQLAGNAHRTPVVRSWSFAPFLGVEFGRVLEAPPSDPEMVTTTGDAVVEDDSFVRYKAGFDLEFVVGPLTLAVSETFRLLDSKGDDTQNIFATTLSFQLTGAQGIGLKFQKGHDIPTFKEVDTLSVTYKFLY